MKTLGRLLKRSIRQLTSRRLYLWAMVIIPLAFCVFFVTLMDKGLPLPVPVSVVDRDGSPLSRNVVRQLQASQYLDIAQTPVAYDQALDDVQSGRSFGFFYIPEGFQQKAFSGQAPTLTFYSNMTIYVPGTMTFKGFKTSAVSTKGRLVATTLTSVGMSSREAAEMVQPIVIQDHPIGNPWLNYAIYLNHSFIPGLIALMVMLTTVFSITEEIKRASGPEWLATAGGSITVAMFGKLLPQTVIFTVVGIASQAITFGFCHNPLNNHALHMIFAMVMLVIASQAFAIIACEIVPNMRLALTVVALIGILSFSVDGFSFPVQQMYPAIGIFSYITPLRHYFLIYIDQALNGIPIYYSRWAYISLALFPIVAFIGLPRLKSRLLKPVYVP